MPCGCSGRGTARSYRTPAQSAGVPQSVAAAAQAGAGTVHEVVKSDGAPSGRRFTSLVAAARYAQAIGGTVRPV